jgi:hypothetical protein
VLEVIEGYGDGNRSEERETREGKVKGVVEDLRNKKGVIVQEK